MQYPTPQFIEEEGKIIFFLTFRQFFLLVGGGAVCLFLYFVLPFFFFAICSIFIMGLVAIIAFLKINNQTIVKILLNFIGFATGPKTYTWKKEESPYPFKVATSPEVKNIQEPPTPIPTTSRLSEIKKMVETKK